MERYRYDKIRKRPVPVDLVACCAAQVDADIRPVLVFELVNHLLQLSAGYKTVERRTLLQFQPSGKFFRELIFRFFPLVGNGYGIGTMNAEQVPPGLKVFITSQAYPGKKQIPDMVEEFPDDCDGCDRLNFYLNNLHQKPFIF